MRPGAPSIQYIDVDPRPPHRSCCGVLGALASEPLLCQQCFPSPRARSLLTEQWHTLQRKRDSAPASHPAAAKSRPKCGRERRQYNVLTSTFGRLVGFAAASLRPRRGSGGLRGAAAGRRGECGRPCGAAARSAVYTMYERRLSTASSVLLRHPWERGACTCPHGWHAFARTLQSAGFVFLPERRVDESRVQTPP